MSKDIGKRIVRMLSRKEIANGGRIIIEIDDKVAKIKNLKVDSRSDGPGGSREKVVAFGFDYCYWSVDPEDPQYASQDVVFQDLGTEVLSGAAKGYNICLFAYGQTGSGKTYTMIGTPASLGLTPRICEGLFSKEDDYSNSPSSCRIRVSFLEIYNERVRDLLKQSDQKKPYTLRVREHPETGPYVQGLSQHVVTNSRQIIGLLEEGVANRITAATHVHEASSRSHAIFTIYYTQAVLENNLSSEIASKINLVDLAGSERADPSYCKDRITEGASINKSLVTLGIVISTLAQNSQMFISYQSPNSTSSEGGDNGSLSSPSVAGSIGGVPRKQSYIPYRDSVLTWLLKDSLGGNSKTIMVATVSPANSSYSETMSTLRYASSAKNIINKPRVNEDANVKLIRELREEIERLKGMLLSFELGNLSPFTDGRNGNLKELVLHNEMKRDQLSKDWAQKWEDWKALMDQCNVDINKKRAGVTIDSNLPHLMVLDDDVLSTGVVLYHLREGTTKIGRIDSDQEQDIVLQGQWIERDHCTITSACGVVTLQPALGARCIVNGQEVTDSCRLTQGAIIILGETQKFRFIHPAEAAALRQRRLLGEVSAGNSNCSLEWLDLDGDVTAPRVGISCALEDDSPFCDRRVQDVVPEAHHQKQLDQAASHRTQIRLQKRLVRDLKQDILVGQIRAEQELKFDQALINQQIKDNQQWLLREESLLASLRQQQRQDSVLAETDSEIFHEAESQTGSETSSALLDGGRKRLVQLQVLWRNALWAAERKVRRKKVKFQLERIVKKQKLLEAQRKLEQLETLCWEDNPSQPVELDSGLDATFSAFQKKSGVSSSSSLGNQRLCGFSMSPSQSVLKCEIPAKLSAETVHCIAEKPHLEECLLQASSVPRGSTVLSNDSCPPNLCQVCEGRRASSGEDTSAQRTSPTVSPKIASATDRKSQKMGRNSQLVRLHRNLVSVSRSAEQFKSREKLDSLIPSPQIGREKPSRSHGPPQWRWRRKGDLLTNWTSRGNGSISPHPQGTKRSVIRGKVQTTRLCQAAWALEQWQPSVASLARASEWPRGRLFGVKDREKRCLRKPVKTEGDEGTWSATVLQASSSSLGAWPQENENDLSDTDSTYSLDSLSCAYTRTLIKPQKQEAPEPKTCCTEPENSESDDSQMSQDSLVEKRNRIQRRLLPCSPRPQASERSEGRPVASPKVSLPPPGSGLPWKKVRTFSLDSLNNEEAFKEEAKEGSPSHSSDEMPVEVFWQMKSSPSLTACEEKVLQLQVPDQGPGTAGPDVPLQTSGSFYLALQPKTEGDDCKSLQQIQHLRNNSLASVDSWFSCDSGSNPNDSQGVNMYSQMNLDIQEPEVQDMEKPKAMVEAEVLQQPILEIATGVYSFSHLQGPALVPGSTSEVSIEPSLDVSSEATRRSQGPHKPGSDATVLQESFHGEGRGLPNLAGYCSPVPSDGTLPSSRSATSLLSHKGRTHRKGRPVVEYLCEFSHSSLGATVKSTKVSSSSQKDTSYLPFTSGKRWDSFFPVCPEMPGDFNFNDPSFSSPSTRCLRTEQEQDGGNFESDDLSTFFRTIEKDAHHSCSSTDLEAGDSGIENAWVFAAENKVSASVTELHQAYQGSSKQPQPLVCRRAGSTVSFDESFFLRDISNSSSPMSAKEDRGPLTWAQQEENLPSKPVPLKLDGSLSQPVIKAELLQSANEEIDRERSFSLALPPDSEPFPPWDPFPPPEQLHPLETFYGLESRDALTETALEIPACREWGEDVPSVSRVEGLNNTFQLLRNLDSDLLLLLHTPNPKNPSSQHVVAERSFSPGTRKDLSRTGVPKSMEKYNNPVSFSSAQNRLLLESISMAACQLGKPARILNNKHPQSSLKIKEKAPAQPSWGVPFNDSGAMMHLPIISSIERDHEHRQSENDIRGKQAGYFLGIDATDFEGQIHSGPNSNFIYKTESSSQTQHRVNMQEKVLVPKKRSSTRRSRCTSPMVMLQDETSSHPREGTEPVSLGIVLRPKDCSEGLMPCGGDHCHGKDCASNLLPAVTSKEEGPVTSKESESLMVIPNSQGEISQRRNQTSSQGKIVNHSEEMARLINSVSQLESSIMEIDSRQKYPPHALYMAEAYRRAMCRDRKDQGMTRLALSPNNFRDSLSHRDQPHSSKKVQEEEVVPNSIEIRGIKEVNGCIQESHQAQKIPPNLTSPTEFVEENKIEREHTLLPVPKLLVTCPSDYLFLSFSQRCTAQNNPANAPESPETVEPLVRIEPLRPEEERSEGSCNEQSASELSSQNHATVKRGSFPELEPKATFQESRAVENLTSTMKTAKCKEPTVHDIDQETNTLWGKSLQTETHPAPLAQELPGVSQIMHTGRYHTQETVHPLPSQEGYPVTSTQEETGNIFSSDSPKLSEKYFRSTLKAVSLSSTDSESELEFLRMQGPTPSEGRVGQKKIYGEARNHSSLRSISCKNSFVEQSVWQSFRLRTVSGLCYQPDGGGSSPSEPSSDTYSEEEMKASATTVLLEQQGEDTGIASKDMNLGSASLTEARVTLLRNIKRASSLNQCLLEKRASHWADSELQEPQALEKKLWRTDNFAMDLSTTSTSLSANLEGKLASSLGFWGASATPSMYPEANVETTVEDTRLSEEHGKSSKDNTDEQIIIPKLTRVSSGLYGASATPSMYLEANVESTVEDTRLSQEHGKSSKDSTSEQIMVPYSETQLDSEAFSGTPKQPHYNQRDHMELARTQDEDESHVCFVKNKATRGHIQEASPGTVSTKCPDKSNPLAELFVADRLQLMKDVTAPSREPEYASLLSFSTIANPDVCKSSNRQTAGETLTGHIEPQALSESPERKEEVIRSPSADCLLASGNLHFPSALKENKRDKTPQQQLFAPSLHAISDSVTIIRQDLSQAWLSKQTHSEVERTSLGSKESIQRAWEGFRSQSTAYESSCGRDSGNSSEAVVDLQTHWGTSIQSPWKDAPLYAGSEISAAEMSPAMANSATLWPDFRSQGSFHNRKQSVSCEAEIVEAEEPPYFDSPLVALDIKQSESLPGHPRYVRSPGSGERKASHKQDMIVSGTVEGGSTGGALPQCPKLKGVTVSGQSVDYGIDSKLPRPTSLLDQNLTPAFVGEMENCPEGSMVPINLETSKSSVIFSPSVSQEEVVTSSRPLCTSQQDAAWINSPSFTNTLSCGNSDSEKRIPRSASDTMLPVFLVSSKLNVGCQSRGPNVPLTHNPDVGEDQQELRLAASNTGLFSMENAERGDIKKKVTFKSEMASLPARTYSEDLQKNKASQNEWEFSPVTESGNCVAAGSLEAIHGSEGILENEPIVDSPHLAQGPQFPKDLRDHSIPIPHPRTKAGKKCIFSNPPSSLWKKDEKEQLSSNVGSTVWDRYHHHSGTSGQASLEESGDSLTIDGKVSRPERLGFLWKRNDGPFVPQGPLPLPEGSQEGLDTDSHSERNSAPCVDFSFSPEHSLKDFSTLKLSVGTSTRSLQELNMSVEPPSPTEDEESRGTERLFLSDFSPDESEMMMLIELGKVPKSAGCDQTASSNYNSEAAGPQPPGTAPYQTSSTLLALSVPEGRASDSLVEEQNGHPRSKGWLAPENTDVMHFMSSDRNPFFQSWQQQGPRRIDWKEYVFGSANDTSYSQISWSLDTQRAVCCSSVDNDLDTLSSPFHSQLSSYANTHGVPSTLSSTEEPLGLEEERKVYKASCVFRNHHDLSDTSTTAPSARTPDKVSDGLPEDSKVPQDESALTEREVVSGQIDGIGPLYPTKSESWPKAGVATCEQGTTTLALAQPQHVPIHCQGCIDVTHPNPEAAVFRSHPPRASWTNMQNLSMHLSQLLHNTSELLGNLSHQGTGDRERSVKAEAPEEAPRVVTVDNSTQTTVDVGIQTDEADPALQDVSLHSPGESKLASPQEAHVTTLKHGSLDGMDAWDTLQKVDHLPVLMEKVDPALVFQEKGPGGIAEKKATSSSPSNQRHYLIPQNSPATSHRSLSFLRHSLAQDLLSLQTSSALSPTLSSQMDGSSCTVVTSPTLCSMSSARGSSLQEGGSTCEPGNQKNKKAGFRGTLLVDRASSPILTLSASTQGPHSSSSSNPTCPRASCSHSTIHHQKPEAAQGAPLNNSSQTCNEGEIKNVSGDSGKSTGKKLSKGSPTSNLSGTLKQSLWLQGSSSAKSTGPLNHPPQLQVRASLGLLGWEEQLAGGKEKHSSWERPLCLSLPTTGLSPTEDLSEASNTSNFVAEVTLEAANPVLVRLASQSTSWCQKKTGTGADASEQPSKTPPPSESPSWGGVLNHYHAPFSISEVSVAPGVSSIVRDTQSEVLLRSCTQKVQASEPRHYSLRDLPVHNKFSNWCGVQGSSPEGAVPVEEATNVDSTYSEVMEKPAEPHEHLSPVPEQLQREQVQVLAGVPLELGPQTPPLSVELAEAKLLYGLGETDALLRVMQSGTGEALVPDTPTSPQHKEMYFRHLKTIEVIRRERSDRFQNFRRARSLSPMKQLSLLPAPEGLVRDPDLPSRRREYLQQLRKDVVETTRNLEPVSDAGGHQSSDIEVLLRDYQRAREETKMEIARARDRLRERAEQEKQRIRQQIVSQLQREEAKLQTLVSVSTLCTTSSMDSLSSCPTSGYDSNLTLASQTQPPEKQGNANLSCFKDTTGGDVRGRSVVRNHQLYLTGSAQKNLGHKPAGESHRVSCDGPQKSLMEQSNSDSCLSTSPCTLYHDLVKHILASTMAEVMAACSNNLQNLFSCQATAGWKYQSEEKDVLMYYKGFPSATRHGFLGAGVVPQPLPRVWAAVRDPTMWPLYNKSIQTAQLYQKVTSSIKLVYLVSNTSMSCLKQPRDFCCVSSEAKEGQLTIMVAQSVYDKSMPRPRKNMIRGEILPSAWVLQPHTVDGKEVTKVIHMVQVELGAPGLPPVLLTHCAKQQTLVIANLASFLCG
ncbi:stAR-related lipid transfer protein 9 [Trichosurus vulpecula]|uniref:stAR-related lipid transfer protein 9 n=1 Tax=Trichosurus vulpecula TaxID=9337 RepID=UPI00186AEBF3|nr:stAR-related lipid transfer protein 9 [Trichosurus vulpecula]